MPLRAALDSLLTWYSVPLIYLEKDIAGKIVHDECKDCNFQEALEKMIEGKGLGWKTVGANVIIERDERETEAILAGTVSDSILGTGVVAADVLLLNEDDTMKVHRWCSTNHAGFFSLRNIEPGNYSLQIRRIGYRTITEAIRIAPGSKRTRAFSLEEEELVQPEITVEGRRSAFSASEGMSRGLYIRATPADQNQYFLEGTRIYNPVHFGGVMSSFSVDALRDVQVFAGGVPPYYGGRIGGILDVALREGAERGLKASAGVGSLGSNLVVEGPVGSQSTFLITGRRSYPDLFLQRYQPNARPSDLHSSELIAKVTRSLGTNQRISLNGYLGEDTYHNSITDPAGTQLFNSLRWGNAALNVRWMGIVSPSLFFTVSAGYTRYGFETAHRLEGQAMPMSQEFLSDYLIEDAALRAHAEYFYDEFHTMLAGVELVRHKMRGAINEFSSQIAPMPFDGFAPWELSVYMQDQWRLVPSALAEVGVRATSFVAQQGSFSAVDPRFSFLVSPADDLRLYSTFTAVNQFVHPYRNSGIFLFYPSIFLYPSTDRIRPSTSLQVSLGAEKNVREGRYRLAVETYYRTTQNLHEFIFDTTAVTSLSEALILGEGTMYGMELTVEKRFDVLAGSLRYSYSSARNRFSALNNGQPFTPRFDRRHELYARLSYSIDPNWTLGFTCLLSSNAFPLFVPIGSTSDKSAAVPTDRLNILPQSQYAEPYDLNGGRLPGFQRLELSLQHRFRSFGFESEATLRFLNGYGLVDPFVWQIRQNTDTRLKWRAIVDAPPLFPLYPVVSLGVQF